MEIPCSLSIYWWLVVAFFLLISIIIISSIGLYILVRWTLNVQHNNRYFWSHWICIVVASSRKHVCIFGSCYLECNRSSAFDLLLGLYCYCCLTNFLIRSYLMALVFYLYCLTFKDTYLYIERERFLSLHRLNFLFRRLKLN